MGMDPEDCGRLSKCQGSMALIETQEQQPLIPGAVCAVFTWYLHQAVLGELL